MSGNIPPKEYPIKALTQYLKIIFLQDKDSFTEPVFNRYKSGSPTTQVYDSAVFIRNVVYDSHGPRESKFRSLSGDVDDTFLVYPEFKSYVTETDVSTKVTVLDASNSLSIAQYNNSFQRGHEWAGIRTDENTSQLRLVVDFSSIMTAPGKEHLLFSEKPRASLIQLHPVRTEVQQLLFDFNNGRVFSAMAKDVPEKYQLRIKWKVYWENLALWEGFYNNTRITPTRVDGPVVHPHTPPEQLRP